MGFWIKVVKKGVLDKSREKRAKGKKGIDSIPFLPFHTFYAPLTIYAFSTDFYCSFDYIFVRYTLKSMMTSPSMYME